MQVFKTYFKLLKANGKVLVIYFLIFIGVAIVLSQMMGAGGASSAFEEEELQIGIIDKDQKLYGKALEEYFGDQHEITLIEDDRKKIVEGLYWRELDYVLLIPKGFEESLTTDVSHAKELNCMKVPGHFDSTMFEAALQQYNQKLEGLLSCGYDMEEATSRLKKLKGEETEVVLPQYINKKQNEQVVNFFVYVPYLFISLGMTGVGLLLITFNHKEVKERAECSSTPLRERIAGLFAGCMLFGMILFCAVVLIGFVISGGKLLTDLRFPFFLLNMFAMLLFGLSLGFLAGTVGKQESSINGMVNIAGLGLCFLGGVFVPQEFFGENILKVAKFFPTYWYVNNNKIIGAMATVTAPTVKTLFLQSGIVVLYAVVIGAIAVVITNMKRKEA